MRYLASLSACATLVGLLIFAPAAALGQAPHPIKWGKIADAEWAVDGFEDDTSATAIILTDYGEAYVGRDYGVTFKRHRRIKILRPEAYDEWGTVAVPFFAEGRAQRVSGVAGQTFTRDENGEVTRHKLGKRSIFKEKMNDEYEVIRFTLPALEPGAIIEYRYTVDSQSPVLLPDWTFQSSEPTLWSEYRAEYPRTLAYTFGVSNVLGFDVRESEVLNRAGGEHTHNRYAIASLPALREEPFMTTRSDYLSAIDVQLAAFYQPGHGQVDVLSTWQELAKDLTESDALGRRLGRSKTVKRMAEDLTSGAANDEEKMIALHDFVRSSIEWDGSNGLFADRALGDVLEAKAGSSGEINLLLIDFLRGAGLTAHPMFISTRSHGRTFPQYPMLNQFNRMLAYVEMEEGYLVIDATNRYAPHTLLPVQALNGDGWVMDVDNPRWASLNVENVYKHSMIIDAHLQEDGTLVGVAQTSDASYSGMFKRRGMDQADSIEDYARDVLLSNLEGVVIDSVHVENQANEVEILKTKVYFTMPSYAQVAGDFIYMMPFVVDRVTENPLKMPERTFPIDMAYSSSTTYQLNLTLPEGFQVEEVPQNVRMAPINRGGIFMRLMEAKENTLSVVSRLNFSRSVYPPSEYISLQEFYGAVVNAHAEPVVIKRATQP
ncbi:MAG: DUF3857 domain-containing protein [Bacteroidota bacterium]